MAMKEDDTAGDSLVDRRVAVQFIDAMPSDDEEYDPDDVTRVLAMQARHATNEMRRRRLRFNVLIFEVIIILGFIWSR